MPSHQLHEKIGRLTEQPSVWEQPIGYDLSITSDQVAVEQLIDDGQVTRIYDPVAYIAEDLYSIQHPDAMDNESQRKEYVDQVISRGEEFGRWFHFTDDGTLVRYPDRQDHFDLRTARNNNLTTKEEQRKIGSATIAIYGLSVGRSIAEGLVGSGIGSTYVLGDFDHITPTNLNRLHSSVEKVGGPKLDDLAWDISRIDPYVKQIHDRSGYTKESNRLLDDCNPDLIIEEVDNLPAKALLRKYASSRKVPLMMVTDLGKKSIIDIEMHNLESVAPFLGKVSEELNEALISDEYSEKQKRQAMSKIVGVRNLSPRIVQSFMDVGAKTTGAPQLRRTVYLGASLATESAEKILLGRVKKSMSRTASLTSILGEKSRDGLRADIGVWRNFLRYMIDDSSDRNK